jgi:hypothetical protein
MLARAHGRCERCYRATPEHQLELHHLDPLAGGGVELAHPDRLLVVCRPCHEQLTHR